MSTLKNEPFSKAGRKAVRRRQVACGMRQVAGKRHIRSTAESNSQALLLLPKNVLAKCRIRIHQGRPWEKWQGRGVWQEFLCGTFAQVVCSLCCPFFLLFSVVDSLHFSGGCLLVLDLEPKGEASTATHTKSGMKNEVAVEAEKERDRKRAREREST